MLAEIGMGLSSLKAAKDIVQGLNAAKTDAAINGVKIELQGLILEAQQGLFAAQEAQTTDARRIADLEQEIVRLKDWSAEKERYALRDLGRGSVAYVEKPDVEGRQAPHWLCANCFEQRRKSFLLPQGHMGPDAIFSCSACKAHLRVARSMKPE